MSDAADVEQFLSKLEELLEWMEDDISDTVRLVWDEGEILGYDKRDRAMDLLANATGCLRGLKDMLEELIQKHMTH